MFDGVLPPISSRMSRYYLPCGQITVDEVDDFQVFHSRSYLGGHVHQAAVTEKFERSVSAVVRFIERSASPQYKPQGFRVRGHRRRGQSYVFLQELVEITVFHKFGYQAERLFRQTAPQHPSDVQISDFPQRFNLVVKIVSTVENKKKSILDQSMIVEHYPPILSFPTEKKKVKIVLSPRVYFKIKTN